MIFLNCKKTIILVLIVADFQLCFYKAFLLSPALKDGDLFFEDTGTGRRILDGQTLIIEIEKSPASIRLVNYLRGYEYTPEGNFR